MIFKLEHCIFGGGHYFGIDDAPDWLKLGGPTGSTTDNRWFWNDHVMQMAVGEKVQTDFHTITRME